MFQPNALHKGVKAALSQKDDSEQNPQACKVYLQEKSPSLKTHEVLTYCFILSWREYLGSSSRFTKTKLRACLNLK